MLSQPSANRSIEATSPPAARMNARASSGVIETSADHSGTGGVSNESTTNPRPLHTRSTGAGHSVAVENKTMTAGRLLGIAFIFCCTAVAWFVLGGTIVQRTGESDGRLEQEVRKLWGGRHQQRSPDVAVRRGRDVEEDVVEKDDKGNMVAKHVKRHVVDDTPVTLLSSRASVALSLDQRRKGLLWYDTYGVTFQGKYRFRNPDAESRTMVVHFPLPSEEGLYDAFTFKVNGQEAPPVT